MAYIKFYVKDNVSAQLDGAINAVQTSILFKNGVNFPTVGNWILTIVQFNTDGTILKFEKCLVSSIAGSTLTVSRGYDGTSAQTFANDSYLFLNVDAKIVSDIQDEVTRLETAKADKATTLSGYGITDAYTQSATNTLLAAKANDSAVMHLTGNETINGTKSFAGEIQVPFGAGSYNGIRGKEGVTSIGSISFFSPTWSQAFRQNSVEITSGTGVKINIRPQDTDLMTLTPTSRVGIGTDNPSEKLEVNGGLKLQNYLNIPVTGGGYYLDVNSGTQARIRSNGTSTGLWVGGFSSGISFNNATTISGGNLTPYPDNSLSCGASGARWSAIWAANGTIQTSDRRQKTDIQETELGLDFIDKLNPVSYKWLSGGNIVTYEEEEIEEEVQETKIVTYKETVIELVEGKYIQKEIEKTREELVFEMVDLFDEKGEIIGQHQIPKMVTKLIKKKKEVITSKPGSRNHFGFIAQEVEEALAGTDFGGLVIDENGQYALRYDQFISPLVAAVKELKARVEFLESKIK